MPLIDIFSKGLDPLNVSIDQNGNSLAEKPIAFLLDDLGLVSVNGVDASKFLQGQITVDVESMADGQAMLAGHCDHKGRLVSNFLIVKNSASSFFLALQRTLCETALQALKKYAVFSKCSVEDCSDVMALLAFEDQVTCHSILDTLKNETASIFSLDFDGADFSSHFLLIALKDDVKAKSLAEAFANLNIFSIIPADLWHQRRLDAGIALLSASTTSDYIPQMLNMDQLDAISWTKGCYTGQEIIARMKYRGKSNRRLFIVNWCNRSNSNSDQVQDLPMPAAIIDSEGKEIGTLIEKNSRSTTGSTLGLAVIRLKSLIADSDTDCSIPLGDGQQILATLKAPNYISTDEIFDDGSKE